MRPPDVIPLGAPGVYVVPERPAAAPLGVPMDECAFVGVAPRGPAWELVDGDDGPERAQAVAVAVRSWDDYRRLYGGFEGPGLLPLAVSAFFEQGGRVAHVVRVVSRRHGALPAGRARLAFGDEVRTTNDGPVALAARNEGSWGNRLVATLSFSTTVLPVPSTPVAGRELVAGAAPLAGGATLRISSDDGAVRLRVVESSSHRLEGEARDRVWVALLDDGVAGIVTRVELVEAAVELLDRDPELPREERFDHLGLMPTHPRWLGDVLAAESRLVEPTFAPGDGIRPGTSLAPAMATAEPLSGADRYELVDALDVMDAGVPVGLGVRDAASICVPDLYSPGTLPPVADVLPPATVAGPTFDECQPLRKTRPGTTAPLPGLPLLLLDPGDGRELAQITGRQVDLVLAAEAAGLVALVDVPPGLRSAAVLHWRRHFSSSYAAAYHPWLRVPRDGARGSAPLVLLPPSSVAAGIIARTELQWGLPRGPANAVAKDVPAVALRIVEPEHGDLHWASVNVFVMEPSGVALTGARTLSTERAWRALTARRVVTMVERAVVRQLQWVVFEPNDATTRTAVTTTVEALLLDLFRAGAFRGATPPECFFVRTSIGPALAAEQDAGALLCEIGLAPTEPMEFLLVRVFREGDATLRTESLHV